MIWGIISNRFEVGRQVQTPLLQMYLKSSRDL